MQRKIVINNKEYTMPKMDVDTYEEYLEIGQEIGDRYTKEKLEKISSFLVKAYGNQFTVEELKDVKTGLDAVGVMLEFQMIEVSIVKEMEKRVEKIQKNFQSGK